MIPDLGSLDLPLTPALAAVVGIVLLVAGRRLFWLAVGAAGFLFALALVLRYLDPESLWLLLGVALVAGVAGAVLAVLLQRLAVALAGFLLGGWAGLALWIELGGGEGPMALLAALAVGVVAALIAGALFEFALVAISALLGAVLVTAAVGVEGSLQLVLVAVLALGGALVQTASRRRRRNG